MQREGVSYGVEHWQNIVIVVWVYLVRWGCCTKDETTWETVAIQQIYLWGKGKAFCDSNQWRE